MDDKGHIFPHEHDKLPLKGRAAYEILPHFRNQPKAFSGDGLCYHDSWGPRGHPLCFS